MKRKKKLWVCPLCKKGALGPQRPRKNNAVRYCLPCTAKKGILIERVSPSDEKKKAEKAEKSKAKKAAKAAKAVRVSPRSWIGQEKYRYQIGSPEEGILSKVYCINVMVMAEKMLKRKIWGSAAEFPQGFKAKTLENSPFRGIWSDEYIMTNAIQREREKIAERMSSLWKNTLKKKGKARNEKGEWVGISIRFSRGVGSLESTGRAGQTYGVTIKGGHSVSDMMTTFVHEFVHVVQGSFFHFQNGKRRPHDYTFNLMMCKVAKSFFGYPFNPYQAGFSIGKGYAPTRHLSEWLKGEIGKENPKVMKWFNN